MAMIRTNKNDLQHFFSNDSKGQLIPEYLDELGKILAQEHLVNLKEVENLKEDIQHIAEIISMQQSISGISSLVEPIHLPDLIESSLNMALTSKNEYGIEIIKKYNECPMIESDKSKLMQILVNLFQNAKDALLLGRQSGCRQIVISLIRDSDRRLSLVVEDNGSGIASEHLEHVFAFGFTTKRKGHGFGLHGAALTAHELGGELHAFSDGPGLGATFILSLPVKP